MFSSQNDFSVSNLPYIGHPALPGGLFSCSRHGQLHCKNIVHITRDKGEKHDSLHFFYDASNKPAVVVYNGTPYTYVKNLQGDIVAILDSNGIAVVQYKYDAWGRQISCDVAAGNSNAAALSTLNPFRYRGYVYDEETGLYYLRSRYYLSQCSRFINGDSIISLKTLLSMSAYTYCHNAPPNRTDLSGMEDAPATMGHKTSCSTSGCDGCYSGPPPAATINPYQFNSILPATPIFDADYQLVDWHYSVIPISDAEAREYVKSCINLKKTHDFPGRVVNIVVMAYIPFDKFFAPLKYGKELAFLGKSSGVLKEVYDASPIAKIDMTFDIQTADYSSMVALYKHPTEDRYAIVQTISSPLSYSYLHGTTMSFKNGWEIPSMNWFDEMNIDAFARIN